jgi:hypothetical protein
MNYAVSVTQKGVLKTNNNTTEKVCAPNVVSAKENFVVYQHRTERQRKETPFWFSRYLIILVISGYQQTSKVD